MFKDDRSKKILKKTAEMIKNGKIVVFSTDTLYGLLASAFFEEAILKIYKIKKRNKQKPLIILISKLVDLERFGVFPNKKTKKILKEIWPGPTSVVLAKKEKNFSYLDRGLGSLAFRMPKKPLISSLLKLTGPLVAPSANPEGLPPALTIRQAKKYFGQNVDLYVAGKITKKPSSIIDLSVEKFEILREGRSLRSLKKSLN